MSEAEGPYENNCVPVSSPFAIGRSPLRVTPRWGDPAGHEVRGFRVQAPRHGCCFENLPPALPLSKGKWGDFHGRLSYGCQVSIVALTWPYPRHLFG
jgi:hypothetical protein